MKLFLQKKCKILERWGLQPRPPKQPPPPLRISGYAPAETTCRRTALQLSEDELKRIRNAVHDEQIFLIVDESTVSGMQY